MPSSSEGILYSCSGERYVADGIRSARSSLRHNDLPHLMFASPVPTDANLPPGLSFESFVPSDNPFIDRITHMRNSPFERTIFLDSDTFVAGDITSVLRLLDRYDVAVAHAPGYRGLSDPDVPSAFYEFNCGVLAWRTNERTAALLANWQKTYVAWLRESPFPGAGNMQIRVGTPSNDQPAFRRCAWKSGVHVIVLGPEYNFRLNYRLTIVEQVRIVHGRHDDYERLVARLNKKRGPRTYVPARLRLHNRAARRLRRLAGTALR